MEKPKIRMFPNPDIKPRHFIDVVTKEQAEKIMKAALNPPSCILEEYMKLMQDSGLGNIKQRIDTTYHFDNIHKAYIAVYTLVKYFELNK